MPPKLKRKGSVSSEAKDDNEFMTSTPLPKRRKKSTRFDQFAICQDLYDTIRSQKSEDGKLLCESFIRQPKRRTEPEYYSVVSMPIDLLKIQHKLKSEEYDDIDQLTADIDLLIGNAKSFYAESSQEYSDACQLMELYHETKSKLMAKALGDTPKNKSSDANVSRVGEDDEEEVPVMEGVEEALVMGDDEEELDDTEENISTDDKANGDHKMLRRSNRDLPFKRLWTPKRTRKKEEDTGVETSDTPTENAEEEEAVDNKSDSEEKGATVEEMFAAAATVKDGDRDISSAFKVLPSKSTYPTYYEVIKDPIDLRAIARKVQANAYSSLDDLCADIFLLVQNTKSFNEPGSIIYRDAVLIKKAVQTKKQEIEQAKQQPLVRSQRIRAKQNQSGVKLSSVVATLDDDFHTTLDISMDTASQGEAADESGTEGSVGGEDEPYWALFKAVRWYKDQNGQVLSEPFLRLPNKRTYPDYYKEIKQPMSLLKIKKRIKTGTYTSLDDIAADFMRTFHNARKYNIDESKIYKDAVKLQTVLMTKKGELEGRDESIDQMSEIIRQTAVTKSRRSLETSSTTSEESVAKKKPGRKSLSPEEALRKRYWLLYKTVTDYQVDGRHLVDIFVTLPSKKDYPDYYQVISEPIDMTMIENKIKTDKYTTEAGLVTDLELMFNNARHFNEDGSQVYKDAELLERVLRMKMRSLPVIESSPSGKAGKTKPKRGANDLPQKLESLYDRIRDFTDARGRTISTPFMKIPSRADYPDYYEIIKKPVDMQKVFQKMLSKQYISLEEMVSDFVLMFDNACRYNEPDSLLYKDALTLQRVCLEAKAQLIGEADSNDVPDVPAAVQEILLNLFISTFNNTDEEGRCYSDSFSEMPSPPDDSENNDSDGTAKKIKPCFEQIKRNLDHGRYNRLDKFQENMFEVFEYARCVSRTDSQLYEDAVELQMFFIRIRNELCLNGDRLLSPALNVTDVSLAAEIEAEKKSKLAREQQEDEDKKNEPVKEEEKIETGAGAEDQMDYKGDIYRVGDFVYVEGREKSEPHIVYMEKLWLDAEGQQFLKGTWFYRPEETYHVATRRFLQKEVFRSDRSENVIMSRVQGKCFVMFVKDYFKMKPAGFQDKDIYVCESKYTNRGKAFKKSKVWHIPKNEHVKIIPRETQLLPVRVASVFAEKTPSDKDIDDSKQLIEKKREKIQIENYPGAEEGWKYFEQVETPAGWIKLGDFVYIRSDEDQPFLALTEKIFTAESGETYVQGHYFIHPAEVEHQPTRMFYHQEVFRSSIEDANPISNIISRCSVLSFKDFVSCRLTEVSEEDVYLCDAKYHEDEKMIKKLNKPLSINKGLNPTSTACEDEIYFFRKHIIPNKEGSPLLMKAAEEAPGDASLNQSSLPAQELSFSGANDSFGIQSQEPVAESTPQPGTPDPVKKKRLGENNAFDGTSPTSTGKERRKRVCARKGPSGYIVFAAECRKEIQQKNQDMSFGEISKIVGHKWRTLEKADKEHYEGKAKRIAGEQQAKQLAADQALNDSMNTSTSNQSPMPDPRCASPLARPNNNGHSTQGFSPARSVYPHQQMPPIPNNIGQGTAGQAGYYQGSPQSPSHMHMKPAGYMGMPPGAYHHHQPPHGAMAPLPPGTAAATPSPLDAGRRKKMLYQSAPTPLHRLFPHLLGRQNLTRKLWRPFPRTSMPHSSWKGTMVNPPQPMGPPPPPARPPSPVFVSVPPRTQRLVHSEAYLRYIENLKPGSTTVGGWQQTLYATPETTRPVPTSRLPTHWLKDGAAHHGDANKALWALRDLMMRDTLSISRTLDFNQL